MRASRRPPPRLRARARSPPRLRPAPGTAPSSLEARRPCPSNAESSRFGVHEQVFGANVEARFGVSRRVLVAITGCALFACDPERQSDAVAAPSARPTAAAVVLAG